VVAKGFPEQVSRGRTQFTCFTSAKVQILTQKALQDGFHYLGGYADARTDEHKLADSGVCLCVCGACACACACACVCVILYQYIMYIMYI
jgi:hypothetical protein